MATTFESRRDTWPLVLLGILLLLIAVIPLCW